MRRGVALTPDKVIISGAGSSSTDKNTRLSTLSERYPSHIQIQTSPTPSCPSRTVTVGLPEPTDSVLYTTPVGPSTNGTGQIAEPGRPQVIDELAAVSNRLNIMLLHQLSEIIYQM